VADCAEALVASEDAIGIIYIDRRRAAMAAAMAELLGGDASSWDAAPLPRSVRPALPALLAELATTRKELALRAPGILFDALEELGAWLMDAWVEAVAALRSDRPPSPAAALQLWLEQRVLLGALQGVAGEVLGEAAERVEAELRGALKFALQPHTLNNILGNIKAMSNQISRSMDSLSSIMEYIFYHGDEHYASVEDEVDFIRSYLKLQDAFSKEINNTKLDLSLLDENNLNYSKKVLPHLITAYLIENAYKHGDVNHPEFLKIQIRLEENAFEIEVRNKVKKNYDNPKIGIGLSNMKSRLKHLKEGKHSFVSSKEEDEYIVNLKINLK
jgi:hypothetical protein